jgi:hypothetical protein
MIELTQAQCEAISKTTESPPTILNPQTQEVYVLLPQELYERLKGVLDEDDVRHMAPLLADLDPEDWEDANAYEGKP